MASDPGKTVVHYQFVGQQDTGYCQTWEAWVAMWQCGWLREGVEAMYVEDGLSYFLSQLAAGRFVEYFHSYEQASRCRCGLTVRDGQ